MLDPNSENMQTESENKHNRNHLLWLRSSVQRRAASHSDKHTHRQPPTQCDKDTTDEKQQIEINDT